MLRILALFLMLLSLSTDLTKADQVYSPPHGFFLMPSNHSGRLYGANIDGADWSIAQWNIPEDLPPFVDNKASNSYASVVAGTQNVDLQQTTANLPCDKVYPSGNKLPVEFDLFASPNNKNNPQFKQAIFHGVGTISDLTSIEFSTEVIFKKALLTDAVCKISQAGLLAAFVATNITARQTFFYQVRLGVVHSNGLQLTQTSAGPIWFFKGQNEQSGGDNQFGYGENVTALGGRLLTLSSRASYHLNILPRVRALIAEGATYNMDQDLSHWRLTGMYFGQNAFGHIDVESDWSAFSLVAN